MLTGLNVLFLANKSEFYRPELTGKWGHYRTEILSF